jgi:acetyl-CoA carboxylase biotin carboxyl carrier protein
MNFKEIQELIKLVSKSNLTEFKYKKGDVEMSIRTKRFNKGKIISAPASPSVVHVPQVTAHAPAPASVPSSAPAEGQKTANPKAASAGEETINEGNAVAVKSPIVGTFYRSASPEKPAFIKVGDRIEVGQVVCIVEAMKLFNEIESEVAGEVVKIIAEDASPVEYDQVLFLVDPTK